MCAAVRMNLYRNQITFRTRCTFYYCFLFFFGLSILSSSPPPPPPRRSGTFSLGDISHPGGACGGSPPPWRKTNHRHKVLAFRRSCIIVCISPFHVLFSVRLVALLPQLLQRFAGGQEQRQRTELAEERAVDQGQDAEEVSSDDALLLGLFACQKWPGEEEKCLLRRSL